MAEPGPVVVALLPSGAETAANAASTLDARLDQRGRDFTDTAAHLTGLFAAGHPIVAVCAAAIPMRALGPLLGDKRSEPPVLAVAEDGNTVVPLLGGHRGANALARRLADMLGAVPAITTAGDAALGVALDEPPEGWHLDNPEDAKPATAALLAGATAEVATDAPWLVALAEAGRATATPAPDPDAPAVLSVAGTAPLIYRRQSVALGVGCARGAEPEAVVALAMSTLAEAGRASGEVAAVHSVDVKADEAAIYALARHLDVPARFHPAARLEAEAPRLATPSEAVFAEVGCHGVAEGAALAAAGPEGRLTTPKRKSDTATCALARLGPGGAPGLPRGRLSVVGIGPGDAAARTPAATRAVAEADELVGYSRYLDLLGPATRGKTRRAFALGEEEARCRHALERAGEGARVALVCSGDGGIYAMGALVTELLDRPEASGGVTAAARRAEIVHVPGITAMQAASSRAGALLGHDFAAVSLSDLLTPRETILRRIRAAAEGDFALAFYNPASRRRRTLLAEARDILLGHRPAKTPVVLATDLGRPGERLVFRHLAHLAVDEVDMLTTVLVGASSGRAVATGDRSAGAAGIWAYTPRGYAAKGQAG